MMIIIIIIIIIVVIIIIIITTTIIIIIIIIITIIILLLAEARCCRDLFAVARITIKKLSDMSDDAVKVMIAVVVVLSLALIVLF
jgi:hypothetical protein